MNAEISVQTDSSGSSQCTHANIKKAKKIDKVCALCNERVFAFWKTRKCVDCRSVFHRKCIVALEKEQKTESVAVNTLTAAVEVTTTDVTTTVRQHLEVDYVTPLYLTLAPWPWTNVTTVTVDYHRRRPTPVTVVVANGHRLSEDLFRGLFEALPVRSRRAAPVARTSPTSYACEPTSATPTPRPQHRRRSAEWSDGGSPEAGDARRPSCLDALKRACRNASLGPIVTIIMFVVLF